MYGRKGYKWDVGIHAVGGMNKVGKIGMS